MAPVSKAAGKVSPLDIFKGVFKEHASKLTRPEDYVNHSLYFEAKTFLNGLLVVEDKLAMAHGLETRVPFLDNDLVDFAMRLPARVKLGNLTEATRINENEPGGKAERYFERTKDGKLILRRMMRRYVPEMTAGREKQGFSAPDAGWFKGESIDFVRRRLMNDRARIYEYLDKTAVQSMIADHLEGRENSAIVHLVDAQSRAVVRGVPMMNEQADSGGPSSALRSLGRLIRVLRNKRDLLHEMVARDLKGAHSGHALGPIWMYLHPIIITVTFMLVFGTVLGTRLSVTADIPGDYTSYILVGLVPWFFTAYLLGRGPSVFTSNSNLVKQVVFPIEILPAAAVIVSCIIYAPTFLLFLIYKLTLGGGLPLSALLAPVTLGLHALLALGVTMALAVLTPFLKDIREIVTVYSGISMYFTPAVYLPDWVPAILRPIIYLNPFSYVVWVYQDTFFFGEIAHPFAWIVLAMLAFAAFFGGLFLMDRTQALPRERHLMSEIAGGERPRTGDPSPGRQQGL